MDSRRPAVPAAMPGLLLGRGTRVRAAVLAAGLVLVATVLVVQVGGLVMGARHDDLAGLLTLLALGATAVTVAGWLLVTAADLARLAATPADRGQPRLSRRRLRVAATLLGVGLGSASSPAFAAPTSPSSTTPAVTAPASTAPAPVSPDLPAEGSDQPRPSSGEASPVDPGPRAEPGRAPARPAASRPDAPAAPQRRLPAEESSHRHVVLRGDTLWGIARAQLPAGTDDAVVARLCHEIYSLNHDVIGSDPDQILPGQVLLVPRATASGTTVP